MRRERRALFPGRIAAFSSLFPPTNKPLKDNFILNVPQSLNRHTHDVAFLQVHVRLANEANSLRGTGEDDRSLLQRRSFRQEGNDFRNSPNHVRRVRVLHHLIVQLRRQLQLVRDRICE